MSCEYCKEKIYLHQELVMMPAMMPAAGSMDTYMTHMEYVEVSNPLFCWRCGTPLSDPEPLTLGELVEMDGEPVWIAYFADSRYGMLDDDDDTECGGCEKYYIVEKIGLCASGAMQNIVCFTDQTTLNLLFYGTNWLAYRRKPKEATT